MKRSQGPRIQRNLIAVFTLLLAGCLLTGCSSTRPITDINHFAAFDEIKKETAGDEAVVTLVDGTKMKATMIHGDRDTLFWKHPDTRTRVRMPTWRISTIKLTDHGKGAGQGLGIGALTGVVLGGLAGYAGGDDPSGFMAFSAEAKAGMGAGAGLALGGVLGLIGGAAAGSSTTYDFLPEEPATQETVAIANEREEEDHLPEFGRSAEDDW